MQIRRRKRSPNKLVKQYFIIAFGLLCCNLLNAQNGKVVAAWKYLQDYYNVKDTASLHSAKESIDIAVQNEKTKDLAKTWLYYGKIYQALFEYKYQLEYGKYKDIADLNKRTQAAYLNTNLNYIVSSSDAYLKSRTLDSRKDYEGEISPRLIECAVHLENIAIANYNLKDYTKALIGFEKSMDLNSLPGKPDTSNLVNARISAELIPDNAKARVLYEKCLEFKVGKAASYNGYAVFLENKMKDDQKALEVIRKGRLLYPDDVSLINDETNFFLKSSDPSDAEKAIANLKLALEHKPDDARLNLALGNVYDRLANLKDQAGKDLPKPGNYDELIVNAEKCSKIAYSLDKNDPTTLFNLGALYNNKAKIMFDKAAEIKDEGKYKAAVNAANAVLVMAKPYLEDALKQNEKDCAVIIALKRMYYITNENDKFTGMSDKAKAFGCE